MNQKIKFQIIFVLIVLFIVLIKPSMTLALEGYKEYTPSRLEWLAVEMNANHRVTLMVENYLMNFVPLENSDSILIYVRYLRNVNRQTMNMSIDSARKVIDMLAKHRGWHWLNVKEDIQLAN